MSRNSKREPRATPIVLIATAWLAQACATTSSPPANLAKGEAFITEIFWSDHGSVLAAKTYEHAHPGEEHPRFGAALFDASTGELRTTLDWSRHATQVEVSPDGSRAAVVDHGSPEVGIFDAANGKLLHVARCRGPAVTAYFVDDQQLYCEWFNHVFGDPMFLLGIFYVAFEGADLIDIETGESRDAADAAVARPGAPDPPPLIARTSSDDDGREEVRVWTADETRSIGSWELDGVASSEANPAFRRDFTAVAVSLGDRLAIVNLEDALTDASKTTAGECRQGDCDRGDGVQDAIAGWRYQGRFFRGHRHGPGRIVDPRGRVRFEGHWEEGKIGGSCDGNCVDGVGTRVSDKGWRYTGPFVDGVAHGRGKVIYEASGKVYEGDVERGKVTGQGVETLPSGERYVGGFYEGTRHGKGRLTRPDGSSLEGVFRDGILVSDGGVEVRADRTRYEGDFREGKWHGTGVETTADGAAYAGGFQHGKRHGWGELRDARGVVVRRGDWRDGSFFGACAAGDCVNGEGTYLFATGARFVGNYQDGKWHGLGRMLGPTGQVEREGLWLDDHYVGRCVRGDCKDGVGRLEDGASSYEGAFKAWKPHGQGKLVQVNGKVFDGAFENGAPHGRTTIRFPDGGYYEGNVAKGVRHGQGYQEYPDGTKFRGTFSDEQPRGSGELTRPDGTVYTGMMPDGAGRLRYPNGDVLEGNFRGGVAWGPCVLYRSGGGKAVGEWQAGEQLPPGVQAGRFPTVRAAWDAYKRGEL